MVNRLIFIKFVFKYVCMTNFDKQKLIEIVLYILNKTKGLDYYHVFKVIYFANIAHLAKYGFRMTTDEFCALPDGPVPSILYNCIKDCVYSDRVFEAMIEKCVAKGNEDAYYMLTAKRKADMDYLSNAEIEEKDTSIKENTFLPYEELRAKSHGEEWYRTYYNTKSGSKIMDVIGMAKEGMANDEMLEYIKDNLAIEEALS